MAVKLQCEICGGKLIGKPGGIFECENCGTEYSTEWARAKIQEITGTVRVEGTVEVAGTVQVDTSANKDNLIKRGFLFLEQSNWENADQYFDKVLDIDSACGEAYLGKLLTKLRLTKKEDLSHFGSLSFYDEAKKAGRIELKDIIEVLKLQDLGDLTEYQNAERFCEPETRESLREVRNRRCYENAVSEMEHQTQDGYQGALELFERIPHYRDADALADQCRKGAQCEKAKFQQVMDLLYSNMSDDRKRKIFNLTGIQMLSTHSGYQKRDPILGSGTHILGLKSDGTVVAEGNNDYGQCNVESWKDIVSIATGSTLKKAFSVGLKSDGTVVSTDKEMHLSDWNNIAAIAANSAVYGLKWDGTVVTNQDYGEVASELPRWKNIVSIAIGGLHVVGLKPDGTAVAAGDNREGQCDVAHWNNITSVAAGYGFSVGLKSDGTVIASGKIDYRAYDVSDWKNIVAIAAESGCVMGLREDGTVVTNRSFYREKSGYRECKVSAAKDLVAIATDGSIKAGLKRDGTVIVDNAGYPKVSTDSWSLFPDIESFTAYLEQKIEQRKSSASESEAAARKREAELAIRRKELSEQIGAFEQEKNAAQTELAELKGLFTGKRRRELETQIAGANRQIEALNLELKKLEI